MLTQTQHKLFAYLKKAMAKTPICPSLEEMRQEMGLKSKSSIFMTLGRLQEKGFIQKLPKKARAIKLLK
ncbi:MAG: hypothetical protein JXQ74_01625 [Alphaproteobacteria bacterium]|nr:hypothetical protein [Alphaproteobacteria bacterium]